jgi:hypothetical protein
MVGNFNGQRGRFERLYREDHEKLTTKSSAAELGRDSFTTNCRKTPKAATGMIDCEGSVLCRVISSVGLLPRVAEKGYGPKAATHKR